MPCIQKGQLRQSKKVDLPELGPDAYVMVRALSARDVLDLRDLFGNAESTDHLPFAAEFVARAVVDDAGRRIYQSGKEVLDDFGASPEHVAVIKRLADASIEVSGVQGEDPEKNLLPPKNLATTSASSSAASTSTPTSSSPTSLPVNGSDGNGSPSGAALASTGTTSCGDS